MAKRVKDLTNLYKDEGSIPGLSGLRIWRCPKPWRRSQMWLRSCVAVAVAAAALIRPLAWECPYASGAALKSKRKKELCFLLTSSGMDV